MSPEEIREKRLAYPLTRRELAKKLGVTYTTILQWESGARTPWPPLLTKLKLLFAKRAGCQCTCHGSAPRPSGSPWSQNEVDVLCTAIQEGQSPDEVIRLLQERFGTSRSREAVRQKAGQFGVYFTLPLHGQSAARLLGISHHYIQSWIAQGYLPQRRHPVFKTGAAGRWWSISSKELESFVDAYAGVLFAVENVRDPALRARALAATRRRQTAV